MDVPISDAQLPWLAAQADTADREVFPGTARPPVGLPELPIRTPAHGDRRTAMAWLTDNRDLLDRARRAALQRGRHREVVLLACAARHLALGPRAGLPLLVAAESDGLTSAERVGDRATQAYLLVRRGHTLRLLGDTADAGAAFSDALDLAGALDDRTRQREALGGRALLALESGDHAGARAGYERVLAMARRDGSITAEAIAVGQLSRVAAAQGDPEEAERHARDALGLRRRGLGEPVQIAYARVDLAVALMRSGKPDAALTQCQWAIRAYVEEGGAEAERAEALDAMAEALARLGRDDEAARARTRAREAREALAG